MKPRKPSAIGRGRSKSGMRAKKTRATPTQSRAIEHAQLKSPAGYGGGPAATAGSQFQHVVGAWALTQLLAEQQRDEVWNLGQAVLQSVSLETTFAVDDIALVGNNASALGQAKNGLGLSNSATSPLASAFDQAVRAHLDPAVGSETGFVIIAGPGSTTPIIRDLANVCGRLRGPLPLGSARSKLSDAAVNQKERIALEVARRHVAAAWRRVSRRAPTVAEIRVVLARVYVDGRAAGDPDFYAREAKRLLRTAVLRTPSQATAAWQALVALAVDLAQARQCADRARAQGALETAGVTICAAFSARDDIARLKAYTRRVLDRLDREGTITLGRKSIRIDRPGIRLLRDAARGGPVVLTGIPGSGKSGGLSALARMLVGAGNDVVALDVTLLPLDGLGAVRTELGLTTDVADVLAAWPGDKPGYILVDALDAARGEGGSETLRALVRDIKCTAPRWRVIASMREYELRNTPALAALFPSAGVPRVQGGTDTLAGLSDVRHVRLGDFTEAELTQICKQIPELVTLLQAATPALRTLLRNPFNLRLAVDLLKAGESIASLRSFTLRVQLLERYWDARVLREGGVSTGDAREAIVTKTVEAMVRAGRLSVPRNAVASDVAASIPLHQVLRANILREYQHSETDVPDRAVLTFAHHILFDYAAGRLLFRGDADAPTRLFSQQPDLILLLRPSLAFHCEWLWIRDPANTSHLPFWNMALSLFGTDGVRMATRVVAPAVAQALVQNVQEFAPLIQAVKGGIPEIRKVGEQLLAEVIFARLDLAGQLPANKDTSQTGDSDGINADVWAALAVELTGALRPPVAHLALNIVADALTRLPAEATRRCLGTAARRLLAFVIAEHTQFGTYHRWRVSASVSAVCETFTTAPDESVTLEVVDK